MRPHFLWLVVAVLEAYGYGIGNSLTIAVVHTLEVYRYVYAQLIFALFAQSLGSYLLLEWIAFRVRAGLHGNAEKASNG